MKFRHNTDIGQNFLRDKSIAEWMVARSAIGPSDRVLEIGAGSGMLTESILSSLCAAVDAIEIDRRLEQYLSRLSASDSRLAIHWGDAVKFDYSGIAAPTHIIANLPYHITTPVIWRLLEEYSGTSMRYMLLMTQAEAAERIASGAGIRMSNPMSITIAAVADASAVRKVPRSAFYPMPRVDSSVVEIKFFEPDCRNFRLPRDETWRRLLSGSFAARRKTLVNNWAASYGAPREKCASVLSDHSLGPLARPEELSLDDWLSLRDDDELTREIMKTEDRAKNERPSDRRL